MNKITEYWKDNIIEIIDDRQYTPLAADNLYSYEHEYFYSDYRPTSQHGIIVKNREGAIIHSAIILNSGGCTTIHQHQHSCCIDGDCIVVCCGNSLFSLALPELKLNWSIQIDEATAFGIYKMKDDFIVHGEMSVSRVNRNGEIIWQEYGSDIFTTPNGKNDFEIIDDCIYVQSWDGRKYRFYYDEKNKP